MSPARMLSSLLGLAALACSLFATAPASADFTKAQLLGIAASPPPHAALPLDLPFRDENGNSTTIQAAIGGEPALVVFADYTCRTLCGPIVEFTADGLARAGLRPGIDYRFLVIGINPRDRIEAARAMRANHIAAGSAVNEAATFLTGDETAIQAATTAVGLHYAYDAAHDQYAHPAAAYVVDGAGRVLRVLSPLALDGRSLRLALIDAGHGAVGTVADRIHLLCYGYDPVAGIYTERITTALGFAAGATVVVMLTGLLAMIARERRRAA